MRIIISNSSPVPIYEQVKEAFITEIIEGTLKENESLPSIRALAKDLKISIMTIKKAYDELENEGYITSVHGKGTYVAPKNNALAQENVQKEIEEYLMKALNLGQNYHITPQDLKDLIDILVKGE